MEHTIRPEMSGDGLLATVLNLTEGAAAELIDGASGDFSGKTVSEPP